MKFRLINLELLMEECFNPEKIESLCSMCEYYNQHFACPSHNFNVNYFLSHYRYALVVSHRLKARLDEYFFWRDLIDSLLLSYENKFRGLSLVAGSCRNCNFCFDRGAYECSSPELLRHSFESLGFDVSSILELYFKEKLSFSPDGLHLVYGMLLKDKPEPIILNDFEGELCEISNQYQG